MNTATHNFNSGPAVLPKEVLDKASAAIQNFNDTGLSILEIGHRSSAFVQILEEARNMVKQLMQLDDTFEVLFLHGGASTQFMQIPYNLLDQGGTAAYCHNGIWGAKAIKEARGFGNVQIACSSEDKAHSYIPKVLKLNGDEAYLHYTTNNTVEGTQWHELPTCDLPLVADMTSDIFSKQLPFNRFALIYAGAQKNLGAAGVNLVVVRRDVLGKVTRHIPTMLDYQSHTEARSILNTPPVFAIYVCWLMLKWTIAEGGIAEMERRSHEKASLLYDTLDRLPLYNKHVVKEDRSLMNVVFTIDESEIEKRFLQACMERGFVGVKGHRTKGGLRVSLYNALPLKSVQVFCDLLHHFARQYS